MKRLDYQPLFEKISPVSSTPPPPPLFILGYLILFHNEMPQVEIFRSTVFVHEWSSMIHFITDIIEVTHQFEDSKKIKILVTY